jgi:hypothetical protein
LRAQLKEKEDVCNSLESEIVCLRKELEKSNTNMKFEKSSATLDEILNCQRSPFDKTGLGYSEKKETAKEDSTSSKQLSEGKPRVMLMCSKILSRLKTTGGKNKMFHMRQIFLTKTKSGRLFHQDGIIQSGTKILFWLLLLLQWFWS